MIVVDGTIISGSSTPSTAIDITPTDADYHHHDERGAHPPLRPLAPPLFPHPGDQRILHAPGVCADCDAFPTFQHARRYLGLEFTPESTSCAPAHHRSRAA